MTHTNWLWPRERNVRARSSNSRKPPRVRLMLQALEDRALPSLPDMPVIRQPESNPTIPPDGQIWDSFTPDVAPTVVVSEIAPAFAEWTRTGRASESIVFSGTQFKSSTTFEAYGQTTASGTLAATNGSLDATGQRGVVVLPSSLPVNSMYLVWAKDNAGAGYSYPIAINRTDAWYAMPDNPRIGQNNSIVSIFGQNLVLDETAKGRVYIEPNTDGPTTPGTGPAQWVKLASANPANPYKVDFQLPSNIGTGDYNVWAHNSHGGRYGFAAPIAITVQEKVTWDENTSLLYDVTKLNTYPGLSGLSNATPDNPNHNDLPAIQAAIDAINLAVSKQNAVNGTVYFPTGTYHIRGGLSFDFGWSGINLTGKSGIRLVGASGAAIAPMPLDPNNIAATDPGYLIFTDGSNP